jgi:asparagine synthetase B (glutamine-hydrolysing)
MQIMINSTNKTRILLSKRHSSSSWEDNHFRIYWEGLPFVSGILSGEESIRVFLNEMAHSGITKAVNLLKGIFFMTIENKLTGDCYAFVDNAGLFQAFYTKDTLSNSFLKLIKQKHYKAQDLNPESVIEFLSLGNIFSYRTFFSDINKIPPDKILHFSQEEAGIHILSKDMLTVTMGSHKSLKDIYNYFENVAQSLSNRNVSIDLTGGIDSRLIALMLNYFGLEFDTAISGGSYDFEDIAISRKVAQILNKPWYNTIQFLSTLEDDLNEIFYASDGLHDTLYYHRLFQFQQDRLSRGCNTVISGTGGELFKDYWWIQDFPFYSKRSPNIKRLVDTRIMPQRPPQNLLQEGYNELLKSLSNRIIQELTPYTLDSNTRTYDNIYFNFLIRESAGRMLTTHNFFIKCYAPLLDPDIVNIGINLPKSQRIFNVFHRKAITQLNPEIARLPTTEGGISSSSELKYFLNDFPRYIADKLRRLLIKLDIHKKPTTHLNNPELYNYARKLKVLKDAVEILKENEIIRKDVTPESIEDNYLGTVLSLGMLVKYINSAN